MAKQVLFSDSPFVVDTTSAQLPNPGITTPNTYAFTSDKGLVVNKGGSWTTTDEFTAATYAAARLVPGSALGDRLVVLGRTATSDGGQGLFTWVPGGTTTIDDGYALQATGGVWQRTENFINLLWYGVDVTGVTDCAATLNLATLDAITRKLKLILPTGLLQILSPWVAYSGTFSTLQVEGQGGTAYSSGRAGYVYPGGKGNTNTMIWANFNDRPAVLVNAVRSVVIKNLGLLGNNLAAGSGTYSYTFPPPSTASSFVTNSCRDSQYSPYAGICIDPLTGTTPADGGYPGLTYGQSSGSGSSNVLIENVLIWGFVVGVMNGPLGNGAQGDHVTCRNVDIEFCRIGLSSGCTQAREFAVTKSNVAVHHTCFDTQTYGSKNAPPLQVTDCQIGNCYALISYNTISGSGRLSGVHAEQFMTIGNGGGSTSTNQCLLFDACDLTIYNTTSPDTGPGCPPAVFTYGGPVNFTACDFNSAGHTVEAWNFVGNDGTAWPVFTSCHFSGAIEAHRIPPIGFQASRSTGTFINCWINANGIGGQSQVLSNNLYRGNNALSIIWGNNIGRLNAHPQTYRVPDSDALGDQREYIFIPGGTHQGATVNVGALTAMTLNANTVTFTRTNASQFFCENDILTYSMLNQLGVLVGSVPALKIPVGGISGNNVTANMLWKPEYYDTVANQPGAGNQTEICVSQWAPTGTGNGGIPTVTCTTNTTVNLTSVSPVGTLLPGDFVIGAGPNAADIPNVLAGACRVVSNDGAGNVVLSKTATGSHSGVGLRFGYLSPVSSIILTVATLPPAIKGLRYFVSDALTPAFGSAVAAGGAVTVPVYGDGSGNWIVG